MNPSESNISNAATTSRKTIFRIFGSGLIMEARLGIAPGYPTCSTSSHVFVIIATIAWYHFPVCLRENATKVHAHGGVIKFTDVYYDWYQAISVRGHRSILINRAIRTVRNTIHEDSLDLGGIPSFLCCLLEWFRTLIRPVLPVLIAGC